MFFSRIDPRGSETDIYRSAGVPPGHPFYTRLNDLLEGAIVAVTLQAADHGDTTTLDETLCEAGEQVAEQIRRGDRVAAPGKAEGPPARDRRTGDGQGLPQRCGGRTGEEFPEKKQKGRRDWQDKRAEQQAVYANRRRVRGDYGKSLLRRRGVLIERSFAHCYETAVYDAVICGGGRTF
jgi:transposase